jgi:hypothetical protein
MHPVSRVRIAVSVSMRSSSSRRQLLESRSQSRFVGVRPAGRVASATRIRSSGMPAALPACTSATRRSVTDGYRL